MLKKMQEICEPNSPNNVVGGRVTIHIIYHGNPGRPGCLDGFTAFTLCETLLKHRLGSISNFIEKSLPGCNIVRHPVDPNDIDEQRDIVRCISEGEIVIMLDVLMQHEYLAQMYKKSSKMLIIDHHSTSIDIAMRFITETLCAKNEILENETKLHFLNDKIEICIDTLRSTSLIVYEDVLNKKMIKEIAEDYYDLLTIEPDLHRKTVREAQHSLQEFVHRINARDLFLEHAPDYNAEFIIALRYDDQTTFDYLAIMLNKGRQESLFREGRKLLQQHQLFIDAAVKSAMEIDLSGHRVLITQSSTSVASDVAKILYQNRDFSAVYNITAESVGVSLRSATGSGADVSAIARKYGGGGHRHASRLVMSHDEFFMILKNAKKCELT